ncbi:MAG: hypothetical protein WBL61_03685 [Bryobacteraceae bacterium]
MKWLLVAITVVATALSDLLQSYELKRAGEQSVSARGIARLAATVARRKYLILSVVFLAFSFFSFMALVQSQPLSFAVPASAASFILETIAAKLVLCEQVGPRRAAGTLLVLSGIILLAR